MFTLFLFSMFTLLGCSPPEEEKKPPPQVTSEGSAVYYTVEQYLSDHPDQEDITARFNAVVQSPAVPVPDDVQKEPLKIAIVYPGNQISDYWDRSRTSFSARLEELNIRHEIYQFFSKGGGVETRKQEQQLKDALALDPDYLIFTLDVSNHLRAIERILVQKKPFLILQNITTPLSAWEDYQPLYVGFDHAVGTRLLAEYYQEQFPTGATYGMLYFSEGYVSAMRGDTFIAFMEEHGVTLAGSFYTEGRREKAKQAALKLLQNNDLDFIYSCATDVAFGAMDAVDELAGENRVLLNGWGGGSAELGALQEGRLAVTVMRMNDDNGVAMAEALRLRLLGLPQEVPTVYSGNFQLVTADITEQELSLLKEKAFRYSGIGK